MTEFAKNTLLRAITYVYRFVTGAARDTPNLDLQQFVTSHQRTCYHEMRMHQYVHLEVLHLLETAYVVRRFKRVTPYELVCQKLQIYSY